MASSNWQRWYREGTVNVTNGSATVRGSNTYWSSASIKAGDVFSIDGVTDYEVSTVNNDTTITLATVYTGVTATGKTYHIHRAFSATTESEVAAQTAALVQDMARYVDTEHATIHGKSAYEIAKDNGYVGTETAWLNSLVGKNAYEVARASGYTGTQAQWLESLKAAGEWSTYNGRTAILSELNRAIWHNSIIRGKNLGSHPTADMYKAIRTGTFEDLWLGDSIGGWIIMGFNCGTPNGPQAVDPVTGEARAPIGGSVLDQTWYQYRGGQVILAKVRMSTDPYYDADDKNEDGTYAGYTSCSWYRKVRPLMLADAQAVFGDAHLYEWAETVPTSYTSAGVPSGSRNTWMRCEMPQYNTMYPDALTLGDAQTGLHEIGILRSNQYFYGNVLPYRKLVSNGAPMVTSYGCRMRDLYGMGYGHMNGAVVGNPGTHWLNAPADRAVSTVALIMIGSVSAESDEDIPS